MRRADGLAFEYSSFAVDYSSLRWVNAWGHMDAVWLRKKRGVVSAQIGELRSMAPARTDDPLEFLAGIHTGRAVDCHGRWDGEQYSGSSRPEVMAAHYRILLPMLESYRKDRSHPWVPDNYTGWWTFRQARRKP